MAKDKNLLIFHNKVLTHISEKSVQFFGGNPCNLRGKHFYEIFNKADKSFLDRLKENKKTDARLVNNDGNIIVCEITKSKIENNELICVYFRDNDVQIVFKEDNNCEKTVYQETIEKNLSILFSYLNLLKNTRNISTVANMKKSLFSFSLDIYDLISFIKNNNTTTSDSTFINFDLPLFIEKEVDALKNKFKNTTINYLPTVTMPFVINANPSAFKELLYSIVEYLSDFSETIVLNLFLKDDSLTFAISENKLFMNLLTIPETKKEVNITDINKLIHLKELSNKAGVTFTCVEHDNKVYKFEFSFSFAPRKKIYESEDAINNQTENEKEKNLQ